MSVREKLKAAERLVQRGETCGGCGSPYLHGSPHSMNADMITVGELVLELLAQDGDEPVTGQWIEDEFGWDRHTWSSDGRSRWQIQIVHESSLYEDIYLNWYEFNGTFSVSDEEHGAGIRTPCRTRDEFRSLVAGFMDRPPPVEATE